MCEVVRKTHELSFQNVTATFTFGKFSVIWSRCDSLLSKISLLVILVLMSRNRLMSRLFKLDIIIFTLENSCQLHLFTLYFCLWACLLIFLVLILELLPFFMTSAFLSWCISFSSQQWFTENCIFIQLCYKVIFCHLLH